MPQLCFSRLIPNFGGSTFQDEGSGVISFARPPPAGHGRTPSEHFLSMLEANKSCSNQSTVMLEAPVVGFPVFYDGRVHVRNSSDNGLNVPIKWTLATLKDDPEHFTMYSANPFGKKHYLYHNGGHLAATSVADWAGRYSARYTSTLKSPRIALSSTERCVMGDPGNDNVYRLDNSPCKLFACNKIETSGTGHGSRGELMDAAMPSKWYNPVDDSNPTCPSNAREAQYKGGELDELIAMSPDEIHALGWPAALGNFVMGLTLSIVGAAACKVACAAGSVRCLPCQGQGGIF